MKALITGIDGFVGGYLSELLIEEGIKVFGTTLNSEYNQASCEKIFRMDILDKNEVAEVISKVLPDYIYHLAGQSSVGFSWEQPALTVSINVIGTINLLDVIREYSPKTRILIVGSSDQYGVVKPEHCPITEDLIMKPQSPYATSKKAQEEISSQYVKAYGLDIIMVRAFNHIGPKQKEGFVVADFSSQIARMERGELSPILRVGNLETERDFTDVRDIVRAYYLLLKNGKPGEVYNVGSGNTYKISEILNKLISFSKIDITIEKDPSRLRPSDVPLIQCNNEKIKQECDWELKYSIEETLIDILNFWRKM